MSAAAVEKIIATVRKACDGASEDVSGCLEGAIELLTDAIGEATREEATGTCHLCDGDGMTDPKLADEWGFDVLVTHEGKLVHADCWEDESEED